MRRQINPIPLLYRHYSRFNAHTDRSVPVLHFGTQGLDFLLLAVSLSIATTGSRSSTKEPELSSRHLYAGHHPPSKQVSDGLIPRNFTIPGFDVI
jgi:hypothetical protein